MVDEMQLTRELLDEFVDELELRRLERLEAPLVGAAAHVREPVFAECGSGHLAGGACHVQGDHATVTIGPIAPASME